MSETPFSIGREFRTRRGPVTTTQLVRYAGASGDFNRIHFDQAFAAESGLGSILVHGMLTMAFAASCLSDLLGPDVRVDEISARFIEPVRVGDTVDTLATIKAVNSDGAAEIDFRSFAGDRAVLKGCGIARLHDHREPSA